QLFTLADERCQLGERTITRRLQLRAGRDDPLCLGLRLAQLGGEPLGAARQLALPLAELTGRAHQVSALGSDANLRDSQAFQALALCGGPAARALEEARQLFGGSCALGHEALGFPECAARGRALGGQRVEAFAGDANLLVEPHDLLGRFAQLHAHLLTALEKPLEIRLHFLNALSQVGEAAGALPDSLAGWRPGTARAAHRRAENALALVMLRELDLQALGLGDQSGEIGSGKDEGTVAALLFQCFVLLGALRLTFERAELTLDLVHHVLHADEVPTGAI